MQSLNKYPFIHIQFLQSALTKESWPCFLDHHGKPKIEIAIVGRSNVGKSSLINHLFKQKYLAKVSSKPGKTQTLNFFSIDENLILVDLPGYGYAKTSKENKENWGLHLQNYFEERDCLSLILLLLDIRHRPTKEDIRFIEWAAFNKKKILIIFTKSDTVSEYERTKNIESHSSFIIENLSADYSIPYISYSTKEGVCRKKMAETINQMLSG